MAKKILLIDDDRLVVKSLGKLLEGEGYVVATAQSGQEAIGFINQEDFDLIISDIRMPNMNGIEANQIINESLKRRGGFGIPTIFITGYVDEQNRQSAEQLKAADLLYKPFDKEEFLRSIVSAIGH